MANTTQFGEFMIKIFRTTLILFCFILFGIGSLILSLVIFPLVSLFGGKKEIFANIIHISWKYFVRFFEILHLIKINVTNYGNISGKIIVASHPSLIDIVILIGLFPKSTCMAKNEISKNPLVKNIIKHIYIVNDIDLEKLKKTAKEYLEEGFNIIIFPTGTRTNPGDDIKIHKGAATISLATGAEIVPINIKTNHPFLCKNQPIYVSTQHLIEYELKILNPINPNDYAQFDEIIARKHICEEIKQNIQ